MLNRKETIIGVLLFISLTIVSFCSWYYLKNDTNFFEQGKILLHGKEQFVDYNILWLWSIGIILFGICIFFLKDLKKAFLFFIWEFILLVASVLFIIGIFVPYLKIRFRLALIVSSFIIYYSIYKAKEYYGT